MRICVSFILSQGNMALIHSQACRLSIVAHTMEGTALCISAVVCPPPPNITQGYWTADGDLVYQTMVTYKCLAGYIFPHRVQQLEFLCSANSMWNGVPPDCKGKEYTLCC